MVNKAATPDVAKIAFVLSTMLIAFACGAIFVKKELPPYHFLADNFNQISTLVKDVSSGLPEIIRIRLDAKDDGVTHHVPEKAFNGFTLVQGTFKEGVEIRLIDMNGTIINRWPADFFKIWPKPEHVHPEKEIPNGPFHYSTQGMWAFPDGSIVFNFTPALGLVKLDRCGNLIWKIDRMTHHSITLDANGGLWVPSKTDTRKIDKDLLLPGMSLDDVLHNGGEYEDRLLHIDPDGNIVQEISVLRALLNGNVEHLMYNAAYFHNQDPSHVNDIEMVTDALAAKIDGVNTGDLLISIRNMHMLAILDQKDATLKWHHIGPWVRQHDPDITEDGNIVVFNNGEHSLARNRVQGSNLIELDPGTGQSRIVYPNSDDQAFFTAIMGTHQTLPNSNQMITVSNAGRIFEITGDGELVWDFYQHFNEEYASNLDSAIRYSTDYFSVQDWACD